MWRVPPYLSHYQNSAFCVSVQAQAKPSKELYDRRCGAHQKPTVIQFWPSASTLVNEDQNTKSSGQLAHTFRFAVKHMPHTPCYQPFVPAPGYPCFCSSDTINWTTADERALFFQAVCFRANQVNSKSGSILILHCQMSAKKSACKSIRQ